MLDEPYYETISYCWGEKPDRVNITANDLPLLVPESSAAVLRRLRHAGEEKTLWIDAVCIDQTNIAERSSQVAMMGHVYSMSKRTWIELGDVDHKRAEAGIREVELLLEEIRSETNDFVDLRQVLYSADGTFCSAKQGLVHDLNVGALEAFLSSPWFR